MTRESIPQFDLYAELEVSRLASVEVIEAAYRVLAKRHHPDVARPDDADRIKRLNLAHNWLIDPARRRRYDNATKPPPSKMSRKTGAGAADPADELSMSARTASKAFGPNTGQVRQFLADLRALDELRAWEIRGGKAAADPDAYASAQHAAFTVGQVEREAEWLLAREAATVIARGKLADLPLQAEITKVLAEVAGAIVIRDLILPADYDQLLLPWTWRDERSTAVSPVGGQPVRVAAGAAAAGLVGARRLFTSPPAMALVALVAVVALAGAWSLLTGSKGPEPAAAVDATGVPTSGASALTSPGSPPSAVSPSAALFDSAGPSASLAPGVTAGPTPTGPFVQTPPPGPTPNVTARPSSAPTPAPTPVPTPAPTPVPTPVPTPSPPVDCQVPSLIGINTNTAQSTWNLAGFTGTVIFLDTLTKPPWKIGWQSLTAGSTAPCTSDVNVAQVAPSP